MKRDENTDNFNRKDSLANLLMMILLKWILKDFDVVDWIQLAQYYAMVDSQQ
jgi:hypothetical protein